MLLELPVSTTDPLLSPAPRGLNLTCTVQLVSAVVDVQVVPLPATIVKSRLGEPSVRAETALREPETVNASVCVLPLVAPTGILPNGTAAIGSSSTWSPGASAT